MGDKLTLGFNTTFIGMGIVFIVLIVLWMIVAFESKIIGLFTKKNNNNSEIKPNNNSEKNKTHITVSKKGKTNGEALIDGNIEDEEIPVILAAVSEFSEIPVSELKIKSIKAIK